MRFGWPHIHIAMQLHKGDFAQSLRDLCDGKDSMRVTDKIACGVVMMRENESNGHAPIYGITERNMDKLCLQNVTWAKAPMMVSGQVKQVSTYCVANPQVLVVSDIGNTVKEASEATYKTVWQINWPGNRTFRTDIGKHMERHLPKLQSHGYALTMEYE